MYYYWETLRVPGAERSFNPAQSRAETTRSLFGICTRTNACQIVKSVSLEFCGFIQVEWHFLGFSCISIALPTHTVEICPIMHFGGNNRGYATEQVLGDVSSILWEPCQGLFSSKASRSPSFLHHFSLSSSTKLFTWVSVSLSSNVPLPLLVVWLSIWETSSLI